MQCFLIIFLILPSMGFARIIHVPADYTEIGLAVSEAHGGDEIVVAPGIYKGSFNTVQNITLRSEYNKTGDWNIVKNTIINGGISINTDSCVISGFTIFGGWEIGINGYGHNATIENNIISKCNNRHENGSGSFGEGAGIYQCNGLIQNNIIEDNESNLGPALAECNGTIQNNLIRNNKAYYYNSKINLHPGIGSAMYKCNGIIRNNTIVDNFRYITDSLGSAPYWTTGGLDSCSGRIANNIIYHTTMTQPLEYNSSSDPSYCLFREAYPGTGNLTGDPKFVDPTHGDYHLKADSPAIDAGKAQAGLVSDPDGHQRGLKGATGAGRGDGSNNDIGAYEALPKPVAIWLPSGGPATIYGGKPLDVAWELAPPAGTAVHLYLMRNGTNVADLGKFYSAQGRVNVVLPRISSANADFSILAAGLPAAGYYSSTPRFKIIYKNAVAASIWKKYF